MGSMKELYVAQQKQRLSSGQISRRQFMASIVAAGVTIPVAMSWATDAVASTPKKGGVFKVGFGSGSTTDSLDPATYEGTINTAIGFSYGNTLTEVTAGGALVPELAESYSSDDAKTWEFKLRKGVEFHNGAVMTPTDVIASINHHRGEDSKSAVKGLVTQIAEMRAEGDSVVFVLEAANADFPYILSDYHLLIMPSQNGEIDATSGIGTGGYIIEKYNPGVEFKAKRNPNYFKENRAHFDEIEFLTILDLTARQNALLTGEVHAIDRVDPKIVTLLSRAPHINILEETSTLHYTMPMRVDAAPFDNYDLRMAIKLSVKRQELVDKILLGHGSVGNDHPISTANRYHASDLAQREFDPDLAAMHYKKSGHSGKIKFSASDAAYSGAVDAALLISASAAEAGIDIEVVREPSDGYWSNVWNKKPWTMSYWSGRPTEDWMFASAYTDDTEWNETAWKTTDAAVRFNTVVKEARSELDDAKRRTLYTEAQTLVHNDGGALIPMFANHIMGVSKDIGHGQVAANWEMDGAKAQERWWFV